MATPAPVQGQAITVATTGQTLIYQAVDGVTWPTAGSEATNIFVARSANDPLQLAILVPAGSTIYFGGSAVSSSVGAPVVVPSGVSPFVFPVTVVGSGSLYAVASGSQVTVGLVVLNHI